MWPSRNVAKYQENADLSLIKEKHNDFFIINHSVGHDRYKSSHWTHQPADLRNLIRINEDKHTFPNFSVHVFIFSVEKKDR